MRFVCYLGGGINRAVHHQQTMAWQRSLFVVGLLSIISDLFLRVIDRVMIISIEANLLTCVITIITVLLYNAVGGNVWVGVTLIACRFFSISFLVSLLEGKKEQVEQERGLPTIQTSSLQSTYMQSAVDTDQDVLLVSRTSTSSAKAQIPPV
ncbi:hypothetical protein GALMADRAFT_1265847 [Galerina marginata CBS 339.88]|uniref:Uncharacterized protein n=1 Tax=Galerina marginata (strain CBS 339.88) TaxID=685588 RepID=A0A067T6B0_GALM3|nr:hypothetical protein GALMADRAFT_1265847 [Galerina marginata CBS 339.88]